MIRWRALLCALALCQPALAAAQERPPERPGPEEPQPQSQPVVSQEPAPVFGPPVPPRWFGLRETDQEYAACVLALSYLGTVYTEEPAIIDPDDRDCGIARPIRVERILPDLTLEGGAVMRCDTARALGFWARDFLRPAAMMLPGAPRVTGLQLGTTYDCRPRVGTGADQPRLSEHALGNAIDIAGFVLDGADSLIVQPRADTGDLAEAFQRTVRAAGCLFFTTVLGPGSNDAHDDHLHLDVAVRRSDWRLCQ